MAWFPVWKNRVSWILSVGFRYRDQAKSHEKRVENGSGNFSHEKSAQNVVEVVTIFQQNLVVFYVFSKVAEILFLKFVRLDFVESLRGEIGGDWHPRFDKGFVYVVREVAGQNLELLTHHDCNTRKD